MSPFSLSDSELFEIMSLAAGVPRVHRKPFLQAVCDALAQYPESSRGAGLVHREAQRLLLYWASNRSRSGPLPGPGARRLTG
jgi:hypothetical protein